MKRVPAKVVHLFPDTVSGFIPLLWLHQLAALDPRELAFSIVVPDASAVAGVVRRVCADCGIAVREVPSLSHLRNPVYALRSYLSLRDSMRKDAADIIHAHFPEGAFVAHLLSRAFPSAASVVSLYASAGEWKNRAPSRALRWATGRATRRADRILVYHQAEEDRLLRLRIGSKYQMARLPFAIPERRPPDPPADTAAESLGLSTPGPWLGIFLPTASRRETRETLLEIAPLQETEGGHRLVCVVPSGRLGETRTVSLRLRLGTRFEFLAGLNRWEAIAPYLSAALFPSKGLVSAAAAAVSLGVGHPVWFRADSPWVDLLPRPATDLLCFGEPYRLREEVEMLVAKARQPGSASPGDDALGPFRAPRTAEQLRRVYLDVLGEKGSFSV